MPIEDVDRIAGETGFSGTFAGAIADDVDEIVRPRHDVPEESLHYDAGVSFKSTHDRHTSTTRTVLSTTAPGAWPIAAAIMGQHCSERVTNANMCS